MGAVCAVQGGRSKRNERDGTGAAVCRAKTVVEPERSLSRGRSDRCENGRGRSERWKEGGRKKKEKGKSDGREKRKERYEIRKGTTQSKEGALLYSVDQKFIVY